ncbi:MAG TPA: nucleoside/nucleotide kinase family protein [Lacisediminihabitans sp.]|uniref:nucleoside/nucleotide kinase family protein n=1 Tax=Lacisediminihabitans sp. TaxID=2787631 RepID=UPI002ED798EA
MILTSVAAAAALIRDAAGPAAGRASRRLVVGLVGAPGAGKSTAARQLVEALGPSAALVGMDGWHLPQSRLVELGRRNRMGASDTFDVDGFVTALAAIRNDGETVSVPGFDREIEEPVPDAFAITPSFRNIVVEGNYLLHDAGGWEGVAPLLDLSLFVRLDRDIRMRRLVERHVRFGKTPDAAAAWANGPDEANARLVEATESRADHILDLG